MFKPPATDQVTPLFQTIDTSDTSTRKSRRDASDRIKSLVASQGQQVHLRLTDGSIIPNVRITRIYGGKHGLVVRYRSPSGVHCLPTTELTGIEPFALKNASLKLYRFKEWRVK